MWPETVWLLNDLSIGPDSLNTPGHPTTIEEWVAYCLPDNDARKAWYVMRYRLENWENSNYKLFEQLLSITNRATEWNHIVAYRYNLTFGLLGYTEGQSNRVLGCLPHIEKSISFRDYHPEVYPYGSYYTLRKRYAKKIIIKKAKQVYR